MGPSDLGELSSSGGVREGTDRIVQMHAGIPGFSVSREPPAV